MYYAAMRPEEVTDLRDDNLASMPDNGWGEFLLTNASPAVAPSGPTTAASANAAN